MSHFWYFHRSIYLLCGNSKIRQLLNASLLHLLPNTPSIVQDSLSKQHRTQTSPPCRALPSQAISCIPLTPVSQNHHSHASGTSRSDGFRCPAFPPFQSE